MGYDGTLKFDTSIDSSGFQAGLSKLSGLASSAIKATTAVIGGAASAVAGIGAAAIKVGSDFEAGMSKVQSISGASATEIQQLAEKAKEMEPRRSSQLPKVLKRSSIWQWLAGRPEIC